MGKDEIRVLLCAVTMSGQHFEDLNIIHCKFLCGCGVGDKEPHSQFRSKGSTACLISEALEGNWSLPIKPHEKVKKQFCKKKKKKVKKSPSASGII